MAKTSRALFFAYLILSAHPLAAVFESDLEEGLRDLSATQAGADADLERASQILMQTLAEADAAERASEGEGMHGATSWHIFGATCPDMLDDLGRGIHDLNKTVSGLSTGGQSALALARLVHKTSYIAKTLEKAKNHKVSSSPGWNLDFSKHVEPCDWAKDTRKIPEHNLKELKNVFANLQSFSPCAPKAKKLLERADTTTNNAEVLIALTTMMADPDTNCTPNELSEQNHETMEQLDRDTEDGEREMDAAVARSTGRKVDPSVFAEVGSNEAIAGTSASALHAMLRHADARMRAVTRRAQGAIDVAGERSDSQLFVAVLPVVAVAVAILVGVVAIILLAILCQVLIVFFTAVFGFILCTIKFLALWIANLIQKFRGKELHQPSIKKCTGWWLEQVGMGHGDGISLTYCVGGILEAMRG